MLISKIFQKGDTLIEVLFAITVFSLVVVGALSIMNSSTAVAERALETTLVRNQIDAQAEALRYIHDSYIATSPNPVAGQPSAEWKANIIPAVSTSASTFGTCTSPTNAFVINTDTDKVESHSVITTNVQTYAQLRLTPTVSSEGLWIEAVQPDLTNNKFIDFHIRACWFSQGLSAQMTLGTIVRLYYGADTPIIVGGGSIVPKTVSERLWETGVDSIHVKVGANEVDQHWVLDRVYNNNPSEHPATWQYGLNSSGIRNLIPQTSDQFNQFQAITVKENADEGGYDHVYNAWKTSSKGRWISTNSLGVDDSAAENEDPTFRRPLDITNANIYVFKLKDPVQVAAGVHLDTIHLVATGRTDNFAKFFVNGCEMVSEGYLRTNPPYADSPPSIIPNWLDTSYGTPDSVNLGAGPTCVSGGNGFKQGANEVEVRVLSTWELTGLLIDNFKYTAVTD